MISRSLDKWNSVSRGELDQIETAHGQVGGTARGRRFATEQINHAYAVLLSSQFQGFCRDLHAEVVDHLVSKLAAQTPELTEVLRDNLAWGRLLNRGNPNPGNLGSDFCRLGLDFWQEVRAHDQRTNIRLERLVQLNKWRNAIAHQDFKELEAPLHLGEVRAWRRACNGLSKSFDSVLGSHLFSILGIRPW